jgi:hypothetical protein
MGIMGCTMRIKSGKNELHESNRFSGFFMARRIHGKTRIIKYDGIDKNCAFLSDRRFLVPTGDQQTAFYSTKYCP